MTTYNATKPRLSLGVIGMLGATIAATTSMVAVDVSPDEWLNQPSISEVRYANASEYISRLDIDAFIEQPKVSFRQIAVEIAYKMEGFTREEYISYENELKRFATPLNHNIFEDF